MGTGFGIMALIVGVERNGLASDTVAMHLLKISKFLDKADAYHGVFPHWLNGETGKTIPFSRKDDGADLVETSFLFQGLFCARQYFNEQDKSCRTTRSGTGLRLCGTKLNGTGLQETNRKFYTGIGVPNNGWAMNFPLHGYNEALITYVLGRFGEQLSCFRKSVSQRLGDE